MWNQTSISIFYLANEIELKNNNFETLRKKAMYSLKSMIVSEIIIKYEIYCIVCKNNNYLYQL